MGRVELSRSSINQLSCGRDRRVVDFFHTIFGNHCRKNSDLPTGRQITEKNEKKSVKAKVHIELVEVGIASKLIES